MVFGYAGRWGEETENNGSVPPNPVDFDSQSYLLKFGWEPNASHRLGVTLEHFERDRFVNALSASKFVPIFDKEVLNWEYQERSRASVSWDFTPENPVWFDSVENQVYYQTTENNSRNHSEGSWRVRDQNIQFETEIYGLQSIFRKEIDCHSLTYGLEFSEYHAENSFYRVDSGLPNSRNYITFAPSDTTRAALFIQDHWKPEQSRWEVIGGLRLDYYHIDPELSADYLERLGRISTGSNKYEPAEELEQITLSPRLDVIYKVNDQTSAYAQYAYGVRNPTAEELSMLFQHTGNTGSITLPNPDLEEEKSHAFELGIKQQTDTRRLHASAFWTRYKDFIENGFDTGRDTPTGQDILTTVNRGEVDIYGFELGGSFQLGELSDKLDGFELGLSTGRTWGVDRERDTWLNSIEPWKSVIYLAYTSSDEKFGARLTGTYVDGVKHIDESAQPLFRPPSYFTLDLSAYWKVSENITVQAGVNNILDEKYWQWGNTRRGGGHVINALAIDDRSTAPGTNAFVSLTYRF